MEGAVTARLPADALALMEIADTPPVYRIAPRRGFVSLGLRELWQYRELLYFLTWRDVKVRYKQTVLGAAWAVLVPVLSMVVFTLFFGRLAKVGSDGMPYPIFAYAALLPWTFFATGLSMSANSLVSSRNLIKKVYFPRMAIPISTILSGFVDFAVALLVLFAMMAWYGVPASLSLFALLPLLLLAFVAALGVGLWLAAVNVKYRDVRYTVPFLVQIWMFATPIVYSTSLVPGPWRTLYALNPMVGVVEGFRWAVLGTDNGAAPLVLVSSASAVAMLFAGAYVFRRMERFFADVV